MGGISVKVVDPKTRETCLNGYTFLLEPLEMVIRVPSVSTSVLSSLVNVEVPEFLLSFLQYKFGCKLPVLLAVTGANSLSIDDFCSTSQVFTIS